MKRAFDLLLSCLAIPFAVPVCLIAAFAVYLECRASPFFLQERLGRLETKFLLLKLRTMHPNTIQAASHNVDRNQILKIGRILRVTKIDELPQLWNVLKGEMSLIGPRPGLPIQSELTQARREYGVFEILPGITGISQISGLDMSSPLELAQADAQYLRKWSLYQDIQILSKTILGKGKGDAVIKRPKSQ